MGPLPTLEAKGGQGPPYLCLSSSDDNHNLMKYLNKDFQGAFAIKVV